MLRGTILMVLALCGAARAEPVRVAASARAGVEVFAAAMPWCAERPAFTVVAERADAFSSAAFADAMQRVGTLVESECPSARGMVLSGTVRGSEEPVWRGSAEIGTKWAMRADAPARPTAAPRAIPATASVTRLDAAGQAKAMAAAAPRFGAYDAARRCVPVTLAHEGSDTSACRKAERAARSEAAGAVRVHVLLSGRGASDCHACSGMVAFTVLDAAGPDWTALAASKPLRSGSFGFPTDARYIEFRRLGRDRWGWTETGSYVGCGDAESSTTVFLAGQAAIDEAGQLPGDRSNMGNCVNGRANGAPCVERTVTLSVDASNPDLDAYPIVLRTVSKTGRRATRRDVVAQFNPPQQKWVAPELPP